MNTTQKNKLQNLNKYSWSLLVVFIGAVFSMHHDTVNIAFADFFQTLPLMIIAVYCCEQFAPLVSQPEHNQKKSELFTRNLFISSFSFLITCLLSLICSYNNSDIREWWSPIVYFFAIYGLLFATYFSAIALLINSRKVQTMFFSLTIIILLFMMQFLRYIFAPLVGNIDFLCDQLLFVHISLLIRYWFLVP